MTTAAPARLLQGQLLAALLLLAVDARTVMWDGYQAYLFERGLDKAPRTVSRHMAALVDVGWVAAPSSRYYELTDTGRHLLPRLIGAS